MIEKIIHFTVPTQISTKQQRLIDKCKELHPSWEIKIWQDPVREDGFLLKNYYEKANSGAQLADLIRLDVIYKYGGIYLDSDIEIIRPLDPLLNLDNFFCSENGILLTNAAFGATKRSPVIKKLIDHLIKNEPDWSWPPNLTTGPNFFARVLKWNPDIILLPRDTFYPYNWNEPASLPKPTTYGIHLWEGSWKKKTSRDNLKRKKLNFAYFLPKNIAKNFINKLIDYSAPIIMEKINKFHTISAYPVSFGLIARTNRNFFMSLPDDDLSITPEIAHTGTYEEAELKFIENHLKGGDFFVDVGCNVGIFTIVSAKKIGPFGRVFAFDPNPNVLAHLKRSLVMNWIHDRVKVFNCAIGDTNKEVRFLFSKYRLGDGNLGTSSESTFNKSLELLEGKEEIMAKQRTLDSFFPIPIEIKILKIDVEGYEHQVIYGAKKLIKNRCFEYIILEILEEVAPTLFKKNLDAVQFIIDNGYSVFKLDNNGYIHKFPAWNQRVINSRNIILKRD